MKDQSSDGHTKLIHALALIDGQFREALGRRTGIQQTAETMYDDWGKKSSDQHDPDLRNHLLERRHAALLIGGHHEDA